MSRCRLAALVLAVAVLAVAVAPPAPAQPRALTLGTAPVGGTYFIYGGVVANLLSEKLGVNVSTQQS
ncbi:MAG TPA: C4-dicarboxylate ABC transporter substrate-binding protein, partial [Methylomirabilota bacterium]|nr:C4-dicarboxylate ABC transporter substrate-binding protein [Methylomirabilota bacterium]